MDMCINHYATAPTKYILKLILTVRLHTNDIGNKVFPLHFFCKVWCTHDNIVKSIPIHM